MKVVDDQKSKWRLKQKCADCGACGGQIKLNRLPNFVMDGAKERKG